MKEALKSLIRRYPWAWHLWTQRRARQLEDAYRRHRELYARMERRPRPLANASKPRTLGDVHTFAIIPMVSWHSWLLPDLRELGPLSHFDYPYRPWRAPDLAAWRKETNDRLLREFAQAHERRPVDWVFSYSESSHLLASTIRRIRTDFGVPCVNMCLDDKQSWDIGVVGEQRMGSSALAEAFDLWWTSARVTVDWVNAAGGHAIYLPEGCLASSFPEEELPYSIPISFVGVGYGRRVQMVRFLRKHGIPVQTFGRGWGKASEVPDAKLVEIFRTSQINLGHGGVGCSETLTNVKGRDFDVPCAGGGVYLTTFNPDLAQHFTIGQEILCWHSYDDLLEQVRWYLDRPELCREIARRARARCLREHRWLHRYQTILEHLGILAPSADRGEPRVTA